MLPSLNLKLTIPVITMHCMCGCASHCILVVEVKIDGTNLESYVEFSAEIGA